MSEQQEYKPGLDGVIASITNLSYLDTDIEQIIIRGYDLIELIKTKHYTDVAYLLIQGELPDSKQSADLVKSLFVKQISPMICMKFSNDSPKACRQWTPSELVYQF